MKKILLAGLGSLLIGLVVFGIFDIMMLIFPLWIFTYLLKAPISRLLSKPPKGIRFIAAGICFGMIVEVLAVFNNINLPAKERILLDSKPAADLVLGFFYYGFVIVSWYFLLRIINFSLLEVFLITGIYGVFAEETGHVFLRMLTHPLSGGVYAILVMFVYGLFPMLALMVTSDAYPNDRRSSSFGAYLLALVILFVQAAVYGNIVYPLLKPML